MLPDQIGGCCFDDLETLKTSSSLCQMPWEEAVIRWNGDVQVCNMFNPYTYGNIYLNSFKNIWNGAFAQVFRNNMNTDFRHPYCRDCVYMGDAYANRSV
jgi:radical SAM protein with 4Fe4S-binding SPASM domain